MRVSLCVVFLALCIVAWECTANSGELDGPQLQGEGGGVSATAAPKQGSPGRPEQPDDRQVEDGDQTGRGEELGGAKEEDTGDDDDEDTQDQSRSDPQEQTPGSVDPPPEKVPKTTTTVINKNPPGAVLTPPADNGRLSTTQVQSTLEAPNNGQKPNLQTHNGDGSVRTEVDGGKTTAHAPGPQNKASSPTEVKTTTITAEGQILSGSQKDKVKEQSTPPKNEDASDLKVTDAAEAATTTTTNAPVNTLPNQSKIPQSVNNKDSSSSSTSLLLAFTTLAVILVLPV